MNPRENKNRFDKRSQIVDSFFPYHSRLMQPSVQGNEPRVNLFSARGARWKRFKALASPGFTVKAMRSVHDTMEDSAINMVNLMAKHEDGQAFNIHEYFQEFTYDVISRLAMGQPNSELFNNGGVKITQAVFMKSHRVLPWYLAVMFPQFEFQIKKFFFNHENIRGGEVAKLHVFCEKAVRSRFTEREENTRLGFENPENDFIDTFLSYYQKSVEDQAYGSTVEKKVTIEDVIGLCFIFLLAGFDTTANTLAYASYLLAQNPEKMKLAQKEIEEVVGGDNVSYDALPKLKYLDAVVKEALRLYPVAWFACSRECVLPTTLGDIYIEKGVKIEADVKSIHRSKEIWGEDADEFVPERWIDAPTRHTMSWIPFGAGPRTCVGMKLGLSEAKTALSHLLRRYDLVTGPRTEKKLKLLGCTTTSPEAVTLYLRLRV